MHTIPYIQQLCPNENSVATLIIPNRTAASDPFVATTIQNAEALFIAGGDQSNYINFWKGTPVEAALNNLIARGVPIGGTSAGMNVLSQFIYSALASQGVTSSQALADPFNKYITLDEDFVNIATVQGVIDDPHFVTRDRMGRDLTSPSSAAPISMDGPASPATLPLTNKPLSSSTPAVTAQSWETALSISCKLLALRKCVSPTLHSPTRTSQSSASTSRAPSISSSGREPT